MVSNIKMLLNIHMSGILLYKLASGFIYINCGGVKYGPAT